jgi:alginate O-acetyltransferase complex protein AlgI
MRLLYRQCPVLLYRVAQKIACRACMVFSSLVFIYLFLPIVLGIYFLIPRYIRNAWLLIASVLFYAWGEQQYILVLLTSIVFNYAMGLAIDRARGSPRSGPLLLGVGITGNLLLLIYFKYANFLFGNLDILCAHIGVPGIALGPVHLPIGISFFTFQAISYLVDIARCEIGAQRNPVDYAMYKAFFPQLIAGPIVRYRDIADQVHARQESNSQFVQGITRFLIGLAKKVLIANVIAVPADAIFHMPTDQLTAGLAWFGAACYALQIYFDFSGYSDMAIGMGHMFGFTFLENFSYPYIATSIRDFWRRWHISLSSWFRDYLYIPLGGNRRGPWRTAFNLLMVFTLCGFWHGAAWTFLAWGLFHGLFLTVEHFGFAVWIDRRWRPFRHAYVLIAVLIGWVLFRSESIAGASSYLTAMVGAGSHHSDGWNGIATKEVFCTFTIALVACTPWWHRPLAALEVWCDRKQSMVIEYSVRTGFLALLFLVSTMALAASTFNPFIYFRF